MKYILLPDRIIHIILEPGVIHPLPDLHLLIPVKEEHTCKRSGHIISYRICHPIIPDLIKIPIQCNHFAIQTLKCTDTKVAMLLQIAVGYHAVVKTV